MTYTVALAVGMLPHRTLAPSTVMPLVSPLTVTWSLASVSWVPSIWSGLSWPAITWWVRILVSVALSLRTALRSLDGILANASSVGAKTVSASAEFSVSTRPALVTAATRVFRSGLALAAEATGAVAMPLSEPPPEVGMAEQPGPKVWAPASIEESELFAMPGDFEPVSVAALLESSLPQAARPNGTVRARAAIPAARRALVRFMRVTFRLCGLREVFGSAARADWEDQGFFRKSRWWAGTSPLAGPAPRAKGRQEGRGDRSRGCHPHLRRPTWPS